MDEATTTVVLVFVLLWCKMINQNFIYMFIFSSLIYF